MQAIKKLLRNKETRNAGWIIGEKLVQMVFSFFIGIYTARFLGPSNYGIINYASAYVSFFTAICNLGVNSIIIKNFIDHPDEEGMTVGTTILLRLAASLLSVISIVCISFVVDRGEPETVLICGLCSLQLIFEALGTINYWFQARYQSKITSIATFVAYVVVSVYRLILLIGGASVVWFALSNALDSLILGLFLVLAYKRHGGPRFSFSMLKGKQLLSVSYHFILSNMMVAIYGQTDKIMLKQMLTEADVGYYGIAVGLCGMWVFLLNAVIQSITPTVMRLYQTDEAAFKRKNREMYGIVFYLSIAFSLGFTILGDLIISILYGADYANAAAPLKIITWYTAFSYLGVARNSWIVCKNKQKYVTWLYVGSAVSNVFLNLLLIPYAGASGAALASLLTQIISTLLLPLLIPALRPNVLLILQAILLKDVWNSIKHKNDIA